MSVTKIHVPSVVEFSGLRATPQESLRNMMLDKYSNKVLEQSPFIVFSDPTVNKRGIELYKMIVARGLGDVWESDVRLNPNSARNLQVYLFCPNDDILKPWLKEADEDYKTAYEDYKIRLAEAAKQNKWFPFEWTPSLPGAEEKKVRSTAKKIIDKFIKS